MEIKPGTFYKTRSGLKARIYAVDGGKGKDMIHGAVLRDGVWLLDRWGPVGDYFSGSESEMDIVDIWTEPKPKLKAYLWPDILKNKYDVVYFEGEATNTIYIRAEWLDER